MGPRQDRASEERKQIRNEYQSKSVSDTTPRLACAKKELRMLDNTKQAINMCLLHSESIKKIIRLSECLLRTCSNDGVITQILEPVEYFMNIYQVLISADRLRIFYVSELKITAQQQCFFLKREEICISEYFAKNSFS